MSQWSTGERSDTCVKPGCGTAACAVGWATAIPELRAEGLKLYWNGIGWVPGFGKRPALSGDADDFAFVGFHEAARFFGLTIKESERLFSPDSYTEHPSPATVASEIRSFLVKKLLVKKEGRNRASAKRSGPHR